MSTSTLQQRLMKRRKDLRVSMTATMELEATSGQSSKRDENVDGEDDGIEGMETAVNPFKEIQEAENLVQKLTSNREKKLKELSIALEPVDGAAAVKAPDRALRKKAKRLAPEELGTREDEAGKRERATEKDGKEPMSTKEAVLAAQTGVVGAQSPGNLNASIRERIKMKVMKAKEKGEVTMREEVEKDPEKDMPSRLLRGLRARDMATRFDEPAFLTKEEVEEDMVVEQSIAARTKWKAALKAVKGQVCLKIPRGFGQAFL